MSSSISLNEIMASLHNFTALSFKAACERADDMAKRICNACKRCIMRSEPQ